MNRLNRASVLAGTKRQLARKPTRRLPLIARCVTTALAACIGGAAWAQDFQTGQRVVVTRSGAPVIVGADVVDALDRGESVLVGGSNGTHVLLRRGHSGWIARQDLIAQEDALDHFNKMIARSPRDAGARAARGSVHVAAGSFAAGAADASDALRLDEQLVHAWLVRSAAERGLKQFAQALRDAEQAIGLDPNLPRAYVAAAESLRMQGQIGRAVEFYSAALRRDPADSHVLLRRGQARLAGGGGPQCAAAVEDFEQAIELSAFDPFCAREALLARGEALVKQNKLDEAIAGYDEMIVKNPYDIRALIGRGTAHGIAQTYILAVPDLDLAVWLNPQISMGYIGRGEFRMRLGKIDGPLGALRDVDDALRIEPNSAVAYRIRGEALAKQEKWDAALAAFGQALKLDPFDAAAYRARALAYDGAQDPNAAIADRRRAAELEQAAAEPLVAAQPSRESGRSARD